MEVITNAFFDELLKLAASEEDVSEARDALKRLERPGAPRIGQYAGIGAVAAPVIRVATDLVKGKPVFDHVKGNPYREFASEVVKGSLASGAVPLIRLKASESADKQILRKYIQDNNVQKTSSLQRPHETLKGYAPAALDARGPSIAQQSKPVGFGRAIPGATKNGL